MLLKKPITLSAERMMSEVDYILFIDGRNCSQSNGPRVLEKNYKIKN